MMLVQRPNPLPMSHNNHRNVPHRTNHHSRHSSGTSSTPLVPSNPTIQVQATKTPGLLTLSRPQPEKKPQRSPRPKQAVAASTVSSATSVAVNSALPQSLEHPSTTNAEKRGRTKERKDNKEPGKFSAAKARKSASQPPAANDPFLVTDASPVTIKASKASTKSTRQRRVLTSSVSPPPSPTKSKDGSKPAALKNLASSAPANGPAFPICDDNDSPPTTPVQATVSLPFPTGSPTSPITSRPSIHKRGVSMSAHSKYMETSDINGIDKDKDLSRLFAGLPSPTSSDTHLHASILPVTPDRRSKRRTMPAQSKSAATTPSAATASRPFFASSVFQNSPGPEELPPPTF